MVLSKRIHNIHKKNWADHLLKRFKHVQKASDNK